jgi:hypothetical protein
VRPVKPKNAAAGVPLDANPQIQGGFTLQSPQILE